MRKLFALIGMFSVVGTALFLLSFLIMMLDGIVVWHLWNWFAVKPLGAPSVTIWQAIGLSMIVSYLTYHYYPFKREEEADIVAPLCHAFIRPFLALLFGWFLHFWV